VVKKAAAEWLIQHGISVNASKDGYTALHDPNMRSSDDAADVVEVLLANGADVYKTPSCGTTALHMAASKGHVKCVKVMVAAGADVNITDKRGMTSLHGAALENNAVIVQLLLEHGAAAVMNNVMRVRCTYSGSCRCAGLTALIMCTAADTIKVLLAAAAADAHATTYEGIPAYT
jgi:ankyrin repeat protein